LLIQHTSRRCSRPTGASYRRRDAAASALVPNSHMLSATVIEAPGGTLVDAVEHVVGQVDPVGGVEFRGARRVTGVVARWQAPRTRGGARPADLVTLAVFARQPATDQGAVGHDAHPVTLAGRQDVVLDCPGSEWRRGTITAARSAPARRGVPGAAPPGCTDQPIHPPAVISGHPVPGKGSSSVDVMRVMLVYPSPI